MGFIVHLHMGCGYIFGQQLLCVEVEPVQPVTSQMGVYDQTSGIMQGHETRRRSGVLSW